MSIALVNRLRGVLPDYMSISDPLGEGGQGAVFRGSCNGSPAAIKLFKVDADTRRIDREIELLSQLDCPHVVKLLNHCSTTLEGDPVRIVAYELHDGGDLSQHVRPGSDRIDAFDLVRIGEQISLAIGTLWTKRIVHRDIKPANIVRAADGRYVLVDVGFARHIDRSDITVAGSPGTTGFRSPEQSRGRRALTLRSDIYSLGVTLYLLATGKHPFRGRDLTGPSTVDTTPLLSRGDLPNGFSETIEEMLEFTAAKRPLDIAVRFSDMGE